MASERIYLDYNAGAPLLPAAREAMLDALEHPGNPSSVHGEGRAARAVIERARGQVAAALGVTPGQVVFTSGASEANALAIRGAGRRAVLASAVEHDSVLAQPGVETLPVDTDGRIDLDAVAARVTGTGADGLLSVMAVNNETGVIQPVAEAAALGRESGLLVHCDATQAIGRMPVDFSALGVDLLTLSAHKIGGPKGAGALILRDGVTIAPLLAGGGQERRRRAGTENVAAIAGFGAAMDALDVDRFARLKRLRDRIEMDLTGTDGTARVFGAGAERVANTTSISMPGVRAETQLMAFDLAGIAVSTGAACSSGKVATSHVLRAMGVSPADADCAIRVSLGPTTAETEVERFIAVWREVRARQAASRAA